MQLEVRRLGFNFFDFNRSVQSALQSHHSDLFSHSLKIFDLNSYYWMSVLGCGDGLTGSLVSRGWGDEPTTALLVRLANFPSGLCGAGRRGGPHGEVGLERALGMKDPCWGKGGNRRVGNRGR